MRLALVVPVALTAAFLTACTAAPGPPPAPGPPAAPVAGDDRPRGAEREPRLRAEGETDLLLGESYTWPSGDTVVVGEPTAVETGAPPGTRLFSVVLEATNGGVEPDEVASYAVRVVRDGTPLEPVDGGVPPDAVIPPAESRLWTVAYAVPADTGPGMWEVVVSDASAAGERGDVRFSGSG